MLVLFWPTHVVQQVAVLRHHPHLGDDPLACAALCQAMLTCRVQARYNAVSHEVRVATPQRPAVTVEQWIAQWHVSQCDTIIC